MEGECFIYKIELNDYLYIGSTKNINHRQNEHNYEIKNGSNVPLYSYCRENCINKVKLIVIECVPMTERYKAEQYYLDEFRTGHKLLNDRNVVIDEKEYNKAYRNANKEKLDKYNKAYREANKLILAEKRKAYKEANKERDKAYREANKEKIAKKRKAYREANKEKIAKQENAYREANKEKLAEYKKAYYETNKKKLKTLEEKEEC